MMHYVLTESTHNVAVRLEVRRNEVRRLRRSNAKLLASVKALVAQRDEARAALEAHLNPPVGDPE
jgi:hypothetical protein